MSVVRAIRDGLVNLVANIGTARDKQAGAQYLLTLLTDPDLDAAYRSSWLPRKIVDVPALDSCRMWRNWQAPKDEISKIEAEEVRLGLRQKILRARILGRLFGGAGILIGTKTGNVSSELDPDTIGAGGITYLTVVPRRQLSAGELEQDPLERRYGLPKWYEVSSPTGSVRIHPSRLVLFGGNAIPDPELAGGASVAWSDSVLQSALDACLKADSVVANIASLTFEAKVDVFRIKNLQQWLQTEKGTNDLLARFRLANIAKGINGALLLDMEEEYQQKTVNFAAMTDVIREFLQIVCGAADVPATRLLGMSPGGMNSTGESDLRNYYDRVRAAQELEMRPAMAVLDECLIRSALGKRDPKIHYAWASLWQTSATENAANLKANTDSIKTLAEAGVFSPDALSSAAANLLIENGSMPGLEEAIAEFPIDHEAEQEAALAAAGAAKPAPEEAPPDDDDGISA